MEWSTGLKWFNKLELKHDFQKTCIGYLVTGMISKNMYRDLVTSMFFIFSINPLQANILVTNPLKIPENQRL